MNRTQKNISEKDYRRYLNNEMSETERNAFEKELQKYPFEAEALEGLQMLDAENFEADMEDLHSRLQHKKKANRRNLWWAAAAAIAVLAVSGTLWVQVREQSHAPQVAESLVEKPEAKGASPENQAAQNAGGINKEDKSPAGKKGIGNSEDPNKPNMAEPPSETPPSVAGKEAEKETLPAAAARDVTSTKKADPLAGEALKDAGEKNEEKMAVDGQADVTYQIVEDDVEAEIATIEEENKDFDFANAAASQKAMIVSHRSASETIVAGNQKAMPMMDEKAFEKYLQSKAILPQDYPKSADSVKVLIKISQNGAIEEILNIHQANTALFDSAVEIIKSGPAWQPAMISGLAIASELELTLVFRK